MALTATQLDAALGDSLTQPKIVEGDQGKVEMQRGRDLVVVAAHLAKRDAVAIGKKSRGLRFTRLLPPGAC